MFPEVERLVNVDSVKLMETFSVHFGGMFDVSCKEKCILSLTKC